jgi:ligand-binding SRPBCC domain-containing protein
MITLRLTTWVNAPVERCFLLATSRGFSPVVKNGVAVPDTAKGSLQAGDEIGWKLGGTDHVSRIDAIRPYCYFREVMTAGIFRHFEHDHHFAPMDDGTRVRDEIRFSLRMGSLGKVYGATVIRSLLMRMLVDKNTELKRLAESTEWQRFVSADIPVTSRIVVTPPIPSRATNMQRFA